MSQPKQLTDRQVDILLSCPGDLETAKNLVDDALRDLSSRLRSLNVTLRVWRHERGAIPAIDTEGDVQQVVSNQSPPDYDIYIGFMCSRIGTPTSRAPSGTIDEFNEARARFIRTGKPDILFYFCSSLLKDAEAVSQQAQVREFRDSYPGLYGSFGDPYDLKSKVTNDVLGVILKHLRTSQLPSLADAHLHHAWAATLSESLDKRADKDDSYLDRSTRFVRTGLNRLQALLDLDRVLARSEADALLAAAYLSCLHRIGADSQQTLEALPGLDQDLARGAYQSLLASLPETDIGRWHAKVDGVRSQLIGALLRICNALALDRQAIRGGHLVPRQPRDVESLEDWLAYFTEAIDVSRGGIVGYRVVLPINDGTARTSILRFVSLRFPSMWQPIRATLL